MTTAEIPLWSEVDAEQLAQALQAEGTKLSGDADVRLDFSFVRRVDPDALRALGTLANKADEKAVNVLLRGVNVNVYKVLKLAQLAPRFKFLA